MPTILSRFDTIFIVKDEHNERRDMVSKVLYFSVNFVASNNTLIYLDISQTRDGYSYERCSN